MSTLVDHNYYTFISDDNSDRFSIATEDINFDDFNDSNNEDIYDLIDFVETPELFPEDNQCLRDVTIDEIFKSTDRQQIDNSVINDKQIKGENGSANTSSDNCLSNSGQKSKNKSKKKSSEVKSGKQLRFLFEKFNRKVNEKTTNDVIIDSESDIKSRLRSRGCNSDQICNKSPLKRTNDEKSDETAAKTQKLTTTIERSKSHKTLASNSTVSSFDKHFTKELILLLEECNQSKKDINSLPKKYLRFIPELKIKRLNTNINSEQKNDSNQLESIPTLRVSSRNKTSTKNCYKQRVVCFKPEPIPEGKDVYNRCLPLNNKFMSKYLNKVFPKTKKQLKCPLRIKVSKKWAQQMNITLGRVYIY